MTKNRGDETAYDAFDLHGDVADYDVDAGLPEWARLHRDGEPLSGPTRLATTIIDLPNHATTYIDTDPATNRPVDSGPVCAEVP